MLRAGGALVWLNEFARADPDYFDPRPPRFEAASVTHWPGGCWEVVSEYRVRFEDAGRLFEAGFLVTLDATEEVKAAAFQSMSSLEVEPEPDCAAINPSRQQFTMHPRRGLPGDVVTVSGNTAIGEDGRYAFGTRIKVAWNEMAEGPHGRVVADIESPAACSFTVRFTVPDNAPGTYPVTLYLYGYPESAGYGLAGVDGAFEVLDD